jgi:flagellar biosynthesis protein FliR
MAGQMADIKLGFAMAAVFDPVTQNRSSIYGRLYNWIGLVLFFTINGHYYLLYSIIESYSFIPAGVIEAQGINIGQIIVIFTKSFTMAFQISAPLLLVGFISDLIMGFIARTVPQLNVFILGMPLKIIIGLITFVILLPQASNLLISVFEDIPSALEKVMR